jgi:hypothetical protein
MISPCCLCVPHQLLNAWTNLYKTWYVYHGTWVHFSGILHKSLLPVCVSACVSPHPIVARQLFCRHVYAATNTRNNRINVGRVVFYYEVRVVLKESVSLYVYSPIVARQRLGKYVPAAPKNYWRRNFIWYPCCIKEKYGISAFYNFLFINTLNNCIKLMFRLS